MLFSSRHDSRQLRGSSWTHIQPPGDVNVELGRVVVDVKNGSVRGPSGINPDEIDLGGDDYKIDLGQDDYKIDLGQDDFTRSTWVGTILGQGGRRVGRRRRQKTTHFEGPVRVSTKVRGWRSARRWHLESGTLTTGQVTRRVP